MAIDLLTLDENLCRMTGDWVQVDTTTNITTDNKVISTSLKNYDHASDDFFTNYWMYIEEGNNLGDERLIYDYQTVGGICNVRGDTLTADSSDTTVRITRTKFTDRKGSINDAIRELYNLNSLQRSVSNSTLITGNVLPNSHFDDWSVSTSPDKYSVTNVTAEKTTTSGLYRGGVASAKITATADDGYMGINSDTYPELLDLRGVSIDFKAWVYPEVSDDAFLTIYTVSPDGTTQTINSETPAYAGKWNLIELESQRINDDINYIEFRFRVHTGTKYCYFDNARVMGKYIYDYLLPYEFQDGDVNSVFKQVSGDIDDIGLIRCDRLWDWTIVSDGTSRYLRFKHPLSSGYKLKLEGVAPFTVLSTYDSTIAISEPQASMLLEYAAYLLYRRWAGPMSSDDTAKLYEKSMEHFSRYNIMAHSFPRKPSRMECTPL